MKKRMLSLLCVLALCLGLLPVTALAAAEGEPDNLYVGDQNVRSGEDTTYWTTDESGGLTRVYDDNDWNVKYDPNTATLTLRGATINGAYDATSLPYGAGIYAQGRRNQAVALTIELIGTNTITGHYGIFVDAQPGGRVGTNASLSITGDGSLTVTGTTSYGLCVISGTGNASLTIEDASVVASSSSSYGYVGVYVMSSNYATNSPNISLSVDGGSLTASASEGNDGIQFYVGSSKATNATTSLTVTDNAIVDARTGGISAYGVNITPEFNIGSTGSTGGIVFDGTEGTVYGNVTLQENLTIGEGETLTIGDGASLDTNGKTITVESGGKLEGTPTGSGTVKIAPTITTESLPDGEVGTAYNQSLTATGDAPITWTVSGTLPDGLSLNSDGTITGTPTAAGSSTVTVKATNSAGSAEKTFTLNIKAVSVTGVTLDPTELSLFTGESATLTVKVEPADATNQDVTWKNSNPDVATVVGDTVKAVGEGEATIIVNTVDGGFTATCTVTVTQATYSISADISPDFGSVYTGYTRPAAQTVTITNTGNQTLNLEQPASTKSFEVGNLSKTQLAPDEKATFTVQPKADLAVGSYEETINISGSNGNHTVSTSVDATFAVVDINDTSVDNKLTVTSGISDNITYYTCPSCGYHNWTATDAGYRCDNCGYLESTRQLSGYGNVKGTYTPGSGATSTAASAVPQTGDESNPVLWTVLLLVSGLALGGLAIAKRKKQQ